MDAIIKDDQGDGDPGAVWFIWSDHDSRDLAFVARIRGGVDVFRQLHPSFHPAQSGRLVKHPGADAGGVPLRTRIDRFSPDRCGGRAPDRTSSASGQFAGALGCPFPSETSDPVLFRGRSSPGLAMVVVAGEPAWAPVGNEVS